MSEFYRKASSGHEYFILNGLNLEISAVINNSILPAFRNGKVLDIGCGEQPLKKYFEQTHLYKGLDHCQNSKNNIDYLTTIDNPRLSLEDQFDIIICTEVMEHVFDWKIAFENMAKLCTASGVILITCPMFYPLHEEPYDFWRPTPYAISKFAELNGFNIVLEKRIGDGKDILGTLLSYSYFYPQDKKLSTIISAKLVNRVRNFILKKLFNKNRILMESPFFMSNLFLLKKN